MIRTGEDYRESIRDGREVHIGERIPDVAVHPAFRPLVDIRPHPRHGARVLADARDLISSDGAGHRLGFQMFAPSPRFNQMAALSFDWDGPLDFVDRVRSAAKRRTSDGAVTRYFADRAEATRAAE